MIRNGSQRGKPKFICRGFGHFKSLVVAPPPIKVPMRKTLPNVHRYIVTAAQNATPVHELGFKSLLAACNHLSAELVVVPYRYKNPTSFWSQRNESDEWWPEEVLPYLYAGRKHLNPNLVLMGDICTQAASPNPLNGFEAITHNESGIFAHPKIHAKSIPTGGRYPKWLTTTGTITVPNYTDTPTGKRGEFHHTIGAMLVEVRGKRFYTRRINIQKSTGEFIVLTDHFTPRGVKRAPRAEALVMGDTHVDFTCPEVGRVTFGPGGMVETLRPKVLVWHDLFDGYSCNPHHHSPFNRIAKARAGRRDVRGEVERAVDYVRANTPKGTESIVVASNHDAFLRRWIEREDWKEDPDNAEFYLETALMMAKSTRLGPAGTEFEDPFIYWVERLIGDDATVKCLRAGEVFSIKNIRLDQHGHNGPNGARGSIRNLRRTGDKSIIAHGHGPGEDEGCVQVGTSTPRVLEYTAGPSGWMNTHATIDVLGKRCLQHIIDEDWRI